MRILITGFEPYWDYHENSSWEVAKILSSYKSEAFEIVTEQMPVSFSHVADALHKAIANHNPDLIVLLGQSGGSERIKLERFALNLMDAKICDNDGYCPDEELIYEDKPAALRTSLPIKKLCSAIENQNIKVKISNSCGLYVCNRVYYEALKICKEHDDLKKAIFVHLPFYEGQPSAKPGKPTLSLEDMVKTVLTIINVTNDKEREI